VENAGPLARTQEWHDIDVAKFRGEIMPRDRPAVLKGLIKDWPAVRAGRTSPQAFCEYIKPFDIGRPVSTAVAPASAKGRLTYRDDMQGFTFERLNETFAAACERILTHLDDPHPPGVYAGAVSTVEYFPGFARDNVLPVLAETVTARIWVSNRVVAGTHYDMSDNVACVVSGHRRFTFFPPEQLPNLYVGPIDVTPAGQPTSLVDVSAPDLVRYPRFAEALAAGEVAELEPGDAVFIPNLWWHNVESLDPFNILVNYWWYDGPRGAGTPFAALVHGIFAVKDLPESRRLAWRRLYDHFVFQTEGEPLAHLKPEQRGMLAPPSPQLASYIRAWLLKALQRS
jgi:hypothetical protein